MEGELYFDISSEEQGGSLYREKLGEAVLFVYDHSTYDAERDDVKVFKTTYATFAAFWSDLKKNKEWFYLHPLFVHPEVRSFVQQELRTVDWTVQGDHKWQDSHQRQWKKVLTDPADYYKPGF
jgi:hypothetical protein